MTKKKIEKVSPQTQNEAMKAAMATQRPGQTKEQTKLIAQGIQKGITHYKKQHKSKSRDLNKKIHKISMVQEAINTQDSPPILEDEMSRNNSLPWVLLAISWLLFVVYIVITTSS